MFMNENLARLGLQCRHETFDKRNVVEQLHSVFQYKKIILETRLYQENN